MKNEPTDLSESSLEEALRRIEKHMAGRGEKLSIPPRFVTVLHPDDAETVRRLNETQNPKEKHD